MTREEKDGAHVIREPGTDWRQTARELAVEREQYKAAVEHTQKLCSELHATTVVDKWKIEALEDELVSKPWRWMAAAFIIGTTMGLWVGYALSAAAVRGLW